MVRAHHGEKIAFLRLHGTGLTTTLSVCREDGLPLRGSDTYEYLSDALDFLATRWKIKTIHKQIDDGEGGLYDEPLDERDQITVDVPKVGILTEEQELFWSFFHKGAIAYNILDGQLWRIGIDFVCGQGNFGFSTPDKFVVGHRLAHLCKWSVPKEPDLFYEKFIERVKQEYKDLNIVQATEPLHGSVAYLERKGLHRFHVVEIQKNESTGLYHVKPLKDEKEEFPYEQLPENMQLKGWKQGKDTSVVSALYEKQQRVSWESLFPKEWDVVAVSRREFYEHTFAGHCYQKTNFFGASGTPSGYAIAWENNYDNMLLIRHGDGNIRCPSEFKGKVIGTGGGNIKGIAKKFGREHWQIKLV